MKLLKRVAWVVLGGWALVLGVAYADLVVRSRQAYAEGLKYLEWRQRPQLKASYYDAKLSAREQHLARDLQEGRVAQDEYQEKLKLLRFERDERVSESDLKYAYVWFQTGCELFSPPKSPWAKFCCERVPGTLELWKQELKAQGVPYQDYMFE